MACGRSNQSCSRRLLWPFRERLAEVEAAVDYDVPVGFQNSAIDSDLRIQAARSYSLISPPSTGRRLIRR
jgi:hypothetical protein